jgi:hypothetical protein
VLNESSQVAEPGTILKVNAEAMEVSYAPGAFAIAEIQAEGKRLVVPLGDAGFTGYLTVGFTGA